MSKYEDFLKVFNVKAKKKHINMYSCVNQYFKILLIAFLNLICHAFSMHSFLFIHCTLSLSFSVCMLLSFTSTLNAHSYTVALLDHQTINKMPRKNSHILGVHTHKHSLNLFTLTLRCPCKWNTKKKKKQSSKNGKITVNYFCVFALVYFHFRLVSCFCVICICIVRSRQRTFVKCI